MKTVLVEGVKEEMGRQVGRRREEGGFPLPLDRPRPGKPLGARQLGGPTADPPVQLERLISRAE